MRNGEWLRGQWIARTAFGLGDGPWQPAVGARCRKVLRELESAGEVERRESAEPLQLAINIPRDEWRTRVPVETVW